MFKSMTILDSLGRSLTLPISDAYYTGYNIVDITGITPSDADIKLSSNNIYDGASYMGYHKNYRTIVFTIKYMMPNYFQRSIEYLRHDIYTYCSIGSKVTLIFETGEPGSDGYRKCDIDGFVKSNKGHVFEECEGCTVTIECPNPWFREIFGKDNKLRLLQSNEVTQLFEFQAMKGDVPNGTETITDHKVFPGYFPINPNSQYNDNNVNTDDSYNKVEFGNINQIEVIDYFYDGEGRPGIIMYIYLSHVFYNKSKLRIYNNKQMIIINLKKLTDTGIDITKGSIKISTNIGDKYIEYNGKSILYAVEGAPDWISFVPGRNLFTVTVDNKKYNDFSIAFKKMYDGI